MTGRINEIFSSIQGEGIYFGHKQVFVRFSGCNLACGYCDTEFEKFEEYDSESLLKKIETYGTIPAALSEVIDAVDIVAMDIKLPSSSGFADDCWKQHYDFLNIAKVKDVFVKAVVGVHTSVEDFLKMLDLFKSLDYHGALVIQPNSRESGERLDEKLALFKKLCADYLIPSCVIPQLHKLIGVR